jgi:hypothetical protein
VCVTSSNFEIYTYEIESIFFNHPVFTGPRECVKGEEIKLSLSKPRRHTRGLEVQIHSFLTSELDESEWLASRPSRFTSGIQRIEGWVGPRAGLGVLGKGKPLIFARSFYCFEIVKGVEYVGEVSRDEKLR